MSVDLLALRDDPAAFQAEICLTTGSGPARFADCMADFQRERFAAINPQLMAVARHEPPPIPRVWDERTKGASKDTDWSINLLWLLAFSRRPLRIQIGAFDAEQADEIRLIVKDILRASGPVNDFLRQVIEVHSDEILNVRTGSSAAILTSDAFGAHGARPDVVLINELTHQPSDAFASTLMDNADKLPNCLVAIVSNAGHAGTWQEQWKQTAQSAPGRWLVLEYNQPSPWVSGAALEESAKRNPPNRYRRLWWGAWPPAEGEVALDPADVLAAFASGFQPMDGTESGWTFVGGCDLGLTRDNAAVVVLGVQPGEAGTIKLAHHMRFKPPQGGKINLTEVENHLLRLDAQFDLLACAYDPWQAEHLFQRLEAIADVRRRDAYVSPNARRGRGLPWAREMPPTGANLRQQASTLIEVFQDHRFLAHACPQLQADLLALRTEEKSYGVRLLSPRTALGHGDSASAFVLALTLATEAAGHVPIQAGAGIGGLFGEPRDVAYASEPQEQIGAISILGSGVPTGFRW